MMVMGSQYPAVLVWSFSGCCSVLMVFVCVCRGVVAIRTVGLSRVFSLCSRLLVTPSRGHFLDYVSRPDVLLVWAYFWHSDNLRVCYAKWFSTTISISLTLLSFSLFVTKHALITILEIAGYRRSIGALSYDG